MSDEPAPAKAPTYPFSVASVLGTAMRVTKRNLVPFLVLAFVLELPSAILLLNAESGDSGSMLLALVIRMITNSLTAAVLAYGVIMELHGSRPPTGVCIARGFGQLGPVIGVSIVAALLIIVATMALVVPGVIVALMFYVIVPVVVVEKLGIDAAMRRSRELTSGRKGDLFLILLLAAGIGIGVQLIARDMSPDVAFWWKTLASAFSSMYFAVTSAVAYVILRQLRDGTQIPEIATAFARIRKS